MLDLVSATLRQQLENQFLTGGAMLVVFTAMLALLRNAPGQLWRWGERRLITTVDIADHDPAFFWVQKWLGDLEYTRTKARILTVSTRSRPVGRDGEDAPSKAVDGHKMPPIDVVFSPAPGNHLIRFHGKFVLLTRERRTSDTSVGTVAYHETLIFRTFSRNLVRDLIFEARALAFPPEDNRITIFKPEWTGWRVAQRRLPRASHSVILKDGQFAEIEADLREFFDSKKWYNEHGIPYQRGHLYWGEPGNGKTSLVVAMASIFGRDIYMMSLASMGDAQLAALVGNLPEHAIVLVEDVDCLFNKRESVPGREDLTFSGFINAIDGVGSPPGRVLILTTNHLDRLDPALIRPGRIDRRFEFKSADRDMAERLFLCFFPGHEHLAARFGAAVHEADRVLSMASLQEHLMQYRKDPSGAAQLPGATNGHREPNAALFVRRVPD